MKRAVSKRRVQVVGYSLFAFSNPGANRGKVCGSIFFNDFHHDPPPPPPEPPPEEPPPELPPDGLEDIAETADVMVSFINEPNDAALKAALPAYQSGGCSAIISNFLIHSSDTPST